MTEPSRALRLSVALAAGTALAYEILLLRLFSIGWFHHTAYMVISVALLGYGASGTLLAAVERRTGGRWRRRFEVVYGTSLVLSSLAMPVCFSLSQQLAVHPEEMLWQPGKTASLTLVCLVLAIPFLFTGLALGLVLASHRPGSVYAWDLLGAGVGSLLVVGLLWLVEPEQALRWLATAGLAAVGLLWVGSPRAGRHGVLVLAAAVPVVWLFPASWLQLEPSPYKGLSQARRVQGARVVGEYSTPLSRVSLLESPVVPLRHAPGLSLASPHVPPEQLAMFVDGDGPTAVTRATDGQELGFLDYTTEALPYHLAEPSSVLVLGSGGGDAVLRARGRGASRVVAVELDPTIVRLLRDELGELTGDLWSSPEVDLRLTDMRGFAARSAERFDLVEHTVPGGVGGGGAALASIAESFPHTVEAVGLYLDRASPDGMLAFTTGVRNPPRDTLKLAGTVIEALERRGLSAAERLIVVRGWQTATLVAKLVPFERDEIGRLERFCAERFFDLVYHPGMTEAAANRFNRLAEPSFHRGVVALLGPDRDDFVDAYDFVIRPATDDRPFFRHVFRWRTLPDLVAARGSGGLGLLDAGYLVLVVSLVQAVSLGLLLVVLPWAVTRRRGARSGAAARGRRPVLHFGLAPLSLYFSALGLGFLFLEVAFLQTFILFLHHPVYSAAVVLASFLIFAGFGSAASEGWVERFGRRAITVSAAGIALVGLVDLALLRQVAPVLAAQPAAARVAAAVGLIAPLAFLMGMPFPIGLTRLRERADDQVPWAWAINGCASVIAPIAATLLALHAGFTAVSLVAMAAYAVAAIAFPGLGGRSAVTGRS